jgi:hypothetical protein
MMAGERSARAPVFLELHSPYGRDALFHLVVHWGSLAEGSGLHLVLDANGSVGPLASMRREELERAGIGLGGGDLRRIFDAAREERCGEPLRLRLDRIYRLRPDRERRSVLPEIVLRPGRPAIAALALVVPPPKPREAPPRFDVVQMAGQRVVGGCTFQIGG